MKSPLSWQDYHRLEGTGRGDRTTHRSSRKTLQTLWQSLINYLSSPSEPHIWRTQDSEGHIHWKAHDPMTGQSVDFLTEDSMRVWLEERHYQTNGFVW